MNENINMAYLAREYLSKINYCDECFCETYCICNGLKKTREPYDGCESNIIEYFHNRETE